MNPITRKSVSYSKLVIQPLRLVRFQKESFKIISRSDGWVLIGTVKGSNFNISIRIYKHRNGSPRSLAFGFIFWHHDTVYLQYV